MIYEIKTAYAPAKPGWMFVKADRIYLIPENKFIELVIEAGRKFHTLVPLAPEPGPIWCTWLTNKQIYRWMIKQLEKIQKIYEKELLKE